MITAIISLAAILLVLMIIAAVRERIKANDLEKQVKDDTENFY